MTLVKSLALDGTTVRMMPAAGTPKRLSLYLCDCMS
jgi:hypothetical protein